MGANMFTETLCVTGELIHERVVMLQGSRSGLPIIVAVHSTALGQAIGGCRLAHYPGWRDGLTDALRLSSAMSDKCALAGLPNGGGKTVVALQPGRVLDAAARRRLLHDVGDVITAFDGAYATGPDVGTSPDDMVTIAERTQYAFCRPVPAGGSGDSSQHTAVGGDGRPARGVHAAVRLVRPVRSQFRRPGARPRRRARGPHARRRRRHACGQRH
jgi:glutamate dehydrogenase/leucine dehydrogenase